MTSTWIDRRVVVTGLGVVTPLGHQLDTFWNNLVSGQCGIDRITAFDATPFDTQIAGQVKDFDPVPAFPSPKEVRRTDRYSQFGIYAGHQALLDSGLNLDQENRDEIGVIIGSGIGGLSTTTEQLKVLLERGPGRLSAFMIPMLISNMASGMFSMYKDLRGPNFATCSACATANHAIGEAWRSIKMGDARVMFAGGAEATIVPIGIGGFCAMRALSTRNDDPKHASRPFDKERDGFIMGEGAGVIVLEDLEHAKKRGARIYCEIVGYGNTADAYHLTAPPPGGEGAARCMRMALSTVKAPVDYVNPHATATPIGDLKEIEAIREVFGDKCPPIAATKSLSGHSLGAAGVQEAIYSLLMMNSGFICESANIETLDPAFADMPIVRARRDNVALGCVLSNSFGFGGTNASVVFKHVDA